ncbi:polysaccharide deacetylase family protein [Massilia terrae]|uniref:Polysaccharide deacetylase family protein n=1 Tax=Massilia terrae TaxID=1811224 RepID=A0ABT2CT39_9BURK|nr:polysaccharide deacetylase family protein [Massilia terrae]MCS0657150.1 polysaccharide deacetylase family protein [Massilia terrae]
MAVLAALVVLAGGKAASAAPAASAGCGADALGTSRTLTLKRAYGAWGKVQHDPLPLNKGEVVLTFDDGPRPETTPRVLQALAAQCVKATFFMVGDNIARFPDLARRVAGEGHSTGMHSYRHTHPGTLTPDQQLADLKQTQDVYRAAFGAAAPAYRFPFLEETPTLMAALKAEKLAVMSVDLGIGDWEADVTTGTLAARLLESLQATGGGIILMHDAYGPPADALPVLLKLLKQNGYKVVHLEWRD